VGFFSTRLEITERLILDRRDGGEGDVALVVECLRLNSGSALLGCCSCGK